MKKLETAPTKDNIYKSLLSDSVQRNKYLCRFVELVSSIEGGYSIAVDGDWGSGKTFFLHQVQLLMDAQNNGLGDKSLLSDNEFKELKSRFQIIEGKDYPKHITVYYDAWLNDYNIDPIASIVVNILDAVSEKYNLNVKFDEPLLTKAKNVGKNIVSGVISNKTGIDLTKIADDLSNEFIQSVSNRRKLIDDINSFIDLVISSSKSKRMLIIVDELDRCKPKFAVAILERIKHYFANDDITFIFGINSDELKHTICCEYGLGFNGRGYLDRFFDLIYLLPRPNYNQFLSEIDSWDQEHTDIIVATKTIEYTGMSLRVASKYAMMMKVLTYNNNNNRRSSGSELIYGKRFVDLYILPILIGLKVSDVEKYKSFIEGKNSDPLISIIGGLDYCKLRCLLSDNEFYTGMEKEPGRNQEISISQKLEELYTAIFRGEHNQKYPGYSVGRTVFDQDTLNYLEDTISFLTDNIDLS